MWILLASLAMAQTSTTGAESRPLEQRAEELEAELEDRSADLVALEVKAAALLALVESLPDAVAAVPVQGDRGTVDDTGAALVRLPSLPEPQAKD